MMKINLMELGMIQKDNGVKTVPTYAQVMPTTSTLTQANVRLYELGMDAFTKVAFAEGKITDNQLLNTRKLTNYTYTLKNNRVYIVDRCNFDIVYGSIAFGNSKLKATDEEMYVQFNIAQKLTCPVMGHVCNKCYADKAFNVVVNKDGEITDNGYSRLRNTILSQFENFVEIINGALDYIKAHTNKKVVFRWHESGDIYSPKYYAKMKEIMFSNPDVGFMIYTRVPHVAKEIKMLNSYDNIMVRFSVDRATPKGLFNYIKKNNIPTFITVGKDDENFREMVKQLFPIGLFCNVKNPDAEGVKEMTYSSSELHCLLCGKCRNKNIIHMYVVIH